MQPPYQQPPYQQPYQHPGQPPQQPYPGQYPPQPGLVAPLGPPQRVGQGVRATALVLLGVALIGLSVFGGYEIALHAHNRLEALLWLLPAIAVMIAITLVGQDTVYSLRCDGRVLEGTGLLGRQGVDLTRLTSVASATAARTASLVLRDDAGVLTVDSRNLVKAGPAVVDAVGRAVWEGQQQGRYVVSQGAAGIWGMPTRPGAPKNGRTGATPRALAGLGLLLVGLVVGVVLALA